MDERVRKLQLRVRGLQRDRVPATIRYPEDVRTEILAVARAGQAAGRSLTSVARDVGVSAPTLSEWLRRPGRLRQVTLAPSAITESSTASPVLVTPQGFRVEGLDVASIVTILRSLA